MDFFTPPRYFRHPEPKRRRGSIYPVFLPFSGCTSRCVFCAQPLQTGRPALEPDEATYVDEEGVAASRSRYDKGIDRILGEAEIDLKARRDRGLPPPEAAFYGGTFTAQPKAVLERCLAAAARWRDQELIAGARCSTRPDAVGADVLRHLSDAGVTRVELGVQSFCDSALERSRRGYGSESALRACTLVREAGLLPGLQLMPGMPGQNREAALADAALAAALRPDLVRLYPCLVLEGTPLALWWRQGDFAPWTLDETTDFLAEACLLFWRAGVPVARMGLAEEPGLAEGVLAGPRHPALGAMARAQALLRIVASEIAALERPGPYGLEVPRRHQGELFGIGNELCAAYAKLGLDRGNIRFVQGDLFAIGVVRGAAE